MLIITPHNYRYSISWNLALSCNTMNKQDAVQPLEPRTFRISEHFSPLNAAAGGLAIGTVAVSRLMLWGKVTGISGILAGIINKPSPLDWAARIAFAGGMVSCGSVMEVAFFGVLAFVCVSVFVT
jgi:hypothetical protein